MQSSKHWLKELFEYGNSIKKDPGRSDGYIKWSKEKSTGNDSGGDETENQIKDLKHNEEKSI